MRTESYRAHRDETNRPRVIVVGTRTFEDVQFLFSKMDNLVQNLTNPIICTGEGLHREKCGRLGYKYTGADRLAAMWALSRGFTLKKFHRDIEKYGPVKAGPIRNREMVTYAAERKPAFLVAFHDGKSPGTADCMRQAKKLGIKVRVIKIKGK